MLNEFPTRSSEHPTNSRCQCLGSNGSMYLGRRPVVVVQIGHDHVAKGPPREASVSVNWYRPIMPLCECCPRCNCAAIGRPVGVRPRGASSSCPPSVLSKQLAFLRATSYHYSLYSCYGNRTLGQAKLFRGTDRRRRIATFGSYNRAPKTSQRRRRPLAGAVGCGTLRLDDLASLHERRILSSRTYTEN